METYNKLQLKADIKKLVETQKYTKGQRKTVKLVGERTIEPSTATWKVQAYKEELRILYAVYGLMRGKKYSEIENHYPEENHPLNKYGNKIGALLVKYIKLEEPVII